MLAEAKNTQFGKVLQMTITSKANLLGFIAFEILAVFQGAALGDALSFYDFKRDLGLFWGDRAEAESVIERFGADRQKLTNYLLGILVRSRPHDFGVRYTAYVVNGHFFERTDYYRQHDQFEIISVARKLIDAGADLNGCIPVDYEIEDRSGRLHEYKKGDNAIILALKSGYDYVAYALYTNTNAPVPLTTESRKAVDAFAETNNLFFFQTLIKETDHGLIDRLIQKRTAGERP